MNIQEFDFSIDVTKALLWRHNDAENLQALINRKKAALDKLNDDFWVNWVRDVFDLRTANAFGLSVWSIILNIPLSIGADKTHEPNSSFGFGSFRKNFNNGNFSSATSDTVLTPEQARLVLRLRYYRLVTRGTIPECNRIVAEVFGDLGEVYALDGLDMTMTYVFNFEIPAALRRILDEYDLLPRPSAVELRRVELPNKSFGFGPFRKNFNNGNFRG